MGVAMVTTQAVKMEIVLKNGGAIPQMGKEGSAGYDITSIDSVWVPAFGRKLIHTGVHIKIPRGYEIQVRPRSGLAYKKGLTVLNSPGTIDYGYLDEIGVILINTSNVAVNIDKGERIAQLVLKKVEEMELLKVDTFTDIEYDRDGGFGSSGEK